ncbi:MAG TPA: 50S ribosomal protein L24 [Candidatus Limnocylindria bacterium]|nr:50S ribosomal protein L24 [Candidatus Limnocylindria bacterium]
MMAHVRKNDTVVVLSGKDKGEQGTVIEVLPKEDKVMVKGLALVTRHIKARKQGDVAGIKKQESYLKLSRVMPICPSCKKPCRINTKQLESGKKSRMCNRCKEIM